MNAGNEQGRQQTYGEGLDEWAACTIALDLLGPIEPDVDAGKDYTLGNVDIGKPQRRIQRPKIRLIN